MKRIAIVLALLAAACTEGCAFNEVRTLSAGESYCNGTPAQCAELYRVAASLHTPEANAAINAARIPGRTQ